MAQSIAGDDLDGGGEEVQRAAGAHSDVGQMEERIRLAAEQSGANSRETAAHRSGGA